MEIRTTQKFLSVRFRVIQRLAEWCESQDRALYTHFRRLRDRGLEGTYQPSETEMIVLTKYLGGYLEVRLSQCFLLEAIKPIMKLINFYEAGNVRIYTMHKEVLLPPPPQPTTTTTHHHHNPPPPQTTTTTPRYSTTTRTTTVAPELQCPK